MDGDYTNDDNNADFFETESYEGYGSRIKNSISGLCFGPLLMIASVVVLVWNEGRNMHRLRDLQEANKLVIHVNDTSTLESSNEGKLLHVSGTTQVAGYLYDDDFGVQQSAIKMKRTVETYQWEEEESTQTTKTSNGGTKKTKRYEYSKTWKRGVENSNNFYSSEYHQNPEYALFDEQAHVADSVSLGAFGLTDTVVLKMNWYQTVTDISVDTVNVDNGYNVQTVDNKYFYFGDDPSNPQVGDTRVSFSVVPAGDTSIIAEQSGNYLVPYSTSRGGQIVLVQRGMKSVAEMMARAQMENATMTWGLRGLGFLLSFMGMGLLVQPISTVVDIVPFVGDLVEMGLGCLAFFVSLTVSTTVIAIAWLFYRPLLGGGLLMFIICIVYWLMRRSKKGTESEVTPSSGPYGSHANYEQYESPHYPSSYQNQSSSLTTEIPFAQALDSPFAQQTSASPALNAPVLGPPVVLPPKKAESGVPVVYKPLS